jgi:hypothetical protein
MLGDDGGERSNNGSRAAAAIFSVVVGQVVKKVAEIDKNLIFLAQILDSFHTPCLGPIQRLMPE